MKQPNRYPRQLLCFTCGTILAHTYSDYELLIDENLIEEKNILLSTKFRNHNTINNKKLCTSKAMDMIMDTYDIKRMCCIVTIKTSVTFNEVRKYKTIIHE